MPNAVRYRRTRDIRIFTNLHERQRVVLDMTVRYRIAHRFARVALPCPPNWQLWWQQARRLPIPWQPLLELLPDDASELALSRRGL